MRILLLCYEYPPIGGGGGVGAQQYAEAWAAAGHDVLVVTSGAAGLPPRQQVNGVEVFRVPSFGRRNRSTASLLSMLSYNLTALLHIARHRSALRTFDLINTHFSIPTGPVAHAASRLLGLPNVLTIIGGDIYDPSKALSPHRHGVLRLINRWIITAADRVVAISSDTKRRAEEHYRIRRPIEVINYGFRPLGSNEDATARPTRSHENFRLIAVGRLIPRKGFDLLIRALKLLPEPVVLRLVGDGPLAESLARLAEAEGVSQRLEMCGYQRREQIHRLLRESDCFVLSSHHEGLGIVVQEAMDAGLPIVATNNGGQVDLIRQNRNGLLVEPGDAAALAAAVRALHAQPELAAAMGRENSKDIRRLYMETNCEIYLDLFRDLVRRRESVTANAG